MKIKVAVLCSLLLLGRASAGEPVPSSGAAVSVIGDVPRSGAVTLAELEGMSPVTESWVSHGVRHSIVGVPLERVLVRFGFDPGVMGKAVAPSEKRLGWKKVLVASAPDGFQAVFSAAELFESMGPTRAYVVWKLDGKPLSAETGPLRLVVTTDKEPSRCIHHLQRLDVVDMRKVRGPGGKGP